MLLRCTETFTTRESGYEQEVAEGTVWQRTGAEVAHGGYELAVVTQVVDGRYAERRLRVRTSRLTECFEVVPWSETTLGGLV